MASERVGDMTVNDLKELIDLRIDRRVLKIHPPRDSHEVEETLDELDKLIWTAPSGAISALQMIREDRDA